MTLKQPCPSTGSLVPDALTDKITFAVRVNWLSMSNVDTVNQCFTAEVVLRLRSLNAKHLRLARTGEPITAASNWDPHVRLLNLRTTELWQSRSKDLSDGEIDIKIDIIGVFGERLELQAFPFDYQLMTLRLSSSRPECAIEFVQDEIYTSVVRLNNFAVTNTFEINPNLRMAQGRSKVEESTQGVVRPFLFVSCQVRRRSTYHVVNILAPLVIISGLTLASFSIPKKDVGDRLAFSVTMLLTAQAFKLHISGDLPQLSYLTLIDKLILGCFAFIVAVVIENALANSSLTINQDRICFLGLLVVICMSSLVGLLICWRDARRRHLSGVMHWDRHSRTGLDGSASPGDKPKATDRKPTNGATVVPVRSSTAWTER